MHPINYTSINSSQGSSDFTLQQPKKSSLNRRINSSVSSSLTTLSTSNHTGLAKAGILHIKNSYRLSNADNLDFDTLHIVDPMIDVLKSLICSGDRIKLKHILSSGLVSRTTIQKAIKFTFKNKQVDECIILLQYSSYDQKTLQRLFLKDIKRGDYLFLEILSEKIHFTPQLLQLSLDLAISERNSFALNFLKAFDFNPSFMLLYLIKAVQDADYLIATELYSFKISNDIRYKAFQEACFFERFSIVENFIRFKPNPLFLGDAFLTAVTEHNLSLVDFLARFSIHSDWVDVALELAAVEGQEDLFKKILLCTPSRRGLIKSLMNAASFDQEIILDLLFNYAIFSNQQITQAITLAQDTRSRRAESYLVNYFSIQENYLSELNVDEEMCWSLEIGLVRKHPEEFLKLWYKTPRKPMKIIFSDEDGIGDGVTRQFYSELVELITCKAIDEEGLPHNDQLDISIFGQLASLISFMHENNFKIGKTFSDRWLKVLRMILSRNGFVSFCFVEIYRNILDVSRNTRNLIYHFLNNPSPSALSVLIKQFSSEAEFMGLDQLPIKEQKAILKNTLIKKYGDHCLMDFLKQQKDTLLSDFDLDSLAFEIINQIYGENIKDLKEAIGFCIDIENQFWKKAWSIFEISKTFLNECSPSVMAHFQSSTIEEIEGCALTDIQKIEMVYDGQDLAIIEKIALLKNVLKEKCEKKETKWLKQFVRFFSASLGFTLNKPIGILEIEDESYPQSQTCFYIIKLAKGFDQTPHYLSSWQNRFLYKLDVAIQQNGFELA